MFAYCQNNPVLYVDPAGLIIVLAPDATEEEIAEYRRAIEYISSSETGKKLIEKLESSQCTITIVFVDDGEMYYDRYQNTIAFDIDCGTVLRSNWPSTLSAAMALVHEMGHAAQDLDGCFDNPNFAEYCEENNLELYEIPIAKELGEPIRNNYSDAIGVRRMQNSTHFRTSVEYTRPWWHYVTLFMLIVPNSKAIDHNIN